MFFVGVFGVIITKFRGFRSVCLVFFWRFCLCFGVVFWFFDVFVGVFLNSLVYKDIFLCLLGDFFFFGLTKRPFAGIKHILDS